MAKKTKRKQKYIKGVPANYVRGAKNTKAQAAEIKSTAKKYKEGKLTKADMNRIAAKRSKNVTKAYKKASQKKGKAY